VEQQQIRPCSLHDQILSRADRRQIWRRIAAQCQPFGYKAGMGKIDAVVSADGNPAREDLLEQRVDIAVAEWPMLVGEVNAYGKQRG